MSAPIEVRLKTRSHPDELEEKVGKILSANTDVSLLLTNSARVIKPDGEPLCVYLKGAITQDLNDVAYPILTKIRETTRNRGDAAGAPRKKVGKGSYGNPVLSSVIGYMDPAGGRFPMCRTTAWSGQNTRQFEALYPLFQYIGRVFGENVHHRFARQMQVVEATEPDWIIPGTPFSTITVNNTYPTGVHQDKGDLQEGFSCLAVFRRGEYTGGWLTFPEWRVSVDMQDGDLLLMDAHEWHGNTTLTRISDDAERISLVLYYRTNMTKCGSAQEEYQKAKQSTAQRLV